MFLWIVITQILINALVNCVEVHFENSGSGFFLKHIQKQTVNPLITAADLSSTIRRTNHDTLSIDHFTIIQTTQQVSIRASYGPFSTKQTVPTRYIVPDPIDATNPPHLLQHQQQLHQHSSIVSQNESLASLLELQQSNVHLDISAHLVRQTIPRDSPVLRVLFHAGTDSGGHVQRQKICLLLHVSMGIETPLKGRCMPDVDDGVCMAEVIIPAHWWPFLPPPVRDSSGSPIPMKVPNRYVQVAYSVFEPPARNPEQCEPKVQIQPLTTFAKVPLVAALMAYKELRADDTLTILIPQTPLYPMSRIHVPVYLQPMSGQNIAVFIVRARVKAGIRILDATATSDDWNVSVDKENAKHTVARVTAVRKKQDPDSVGLKMEDETTFNQVVEVFSWLLEVANDTKDHWDGGKIVWSVSYVHDGPKLKDVSAESTVTLGGNGGAATTEETRRKIVAKLDIQKDDIQAVLPISKNWELMNTAVLTGRQVSQAMKVFIVSQGGKVADVTLQSSCQALDDSVIKVSTSCSSVYIDGTEIRGSLNASVMVKYGTYNGIASFIIWMPEIPLEVSVADFRLSQIKGWKISDESHHNNGKINYHHRKKRAYGWHPHVDDFVNGVNDRTTCRTRYQQSPVDVYARFFAENQDTGRTSYLISRRTLLRVTDLVQPLLRISDPKIATLRGRTLQGRAMGRTDVQVLSPITGRVMGRKEVRVGSDRVSITRLIVRVVSGLQLSISPDTAIENGYIAETSVTRKLTAQYQEGLLDIDIEFSDGARTPLRDVSVDDYFLLVDSLDTEVVAFAPMLALHHPRVIAVGEGNGDLLRVTLMLSEECRMRRTIPMPKQIGTKLSSGILATASATVQVDFNVIENPVRPDTVQNDGTLGREKGKAGELSDSVASIPFKDDKSILGQAVQARQHRGSRRIEIIPRPDSADNDTSSLEIGMYVLLSAFWLPIVVFGFSCIVYALKFRSANGDNNGNILVKDASGTGGGVGMLRDRPRESTTNAHDWVWLGRSTMDRSSVIASDNLNGNLVVGQQRDSRIRITSNPMNFNQNYPPIVDNHLQQITSFDNPNHILLPPPPQSPPPRERAIDTSTYNKRDRRQNNELPPPPLPPHGITHLGYMNDNHRMNQIEYRPPVPPHSHKNIGVTANLISNSVQDVQVASHEPNRNEPKRTRNERHNRKSNSSEDNNVDRRSKNGIANRNSNHNHHYRRSLASQPIGDSTSSEELHMAERLVETAALQKRSAFQFDTITPRQQQVDSSQKVDGMGNLINLELEVAERENEIMDTCDDIVNEPFGSQNNEPEPGNGLIDSTIQSPTINAVELNNKSLTVASITTSDDNGGFVSSDKEVVRRLQPINRQKIKRATVVGNPMFSGGTSDSDFGPTESLGLDDLEMDYEQIKHYFDNLKESNA